MGAYSRWAHIRGWALNRINTVFINGRLAILKDLKCLQLKKELNTKKDCVKMSQSFCVVLGSPFSFEEKL